MSTYLTQQAEELLENIHTKHCSCWDHIVKCLYISFWDRSAELNYMFYDNSYQADWQMLFMYTRKGLKLLKKKWNSFSETFFHF